MIPTTLPTPRPAAATRALALMALVQRGLDLANLTGTEGRLWPLNAAVVRCLRAGDYPGVNHACAEMLAIASAWPPATD